MIVPFAEEHWADIGNGCDVTKEALLNTPTFVYTEGGKALAWCSLIKVNNNVVELAMAMVSRPTHTRQFLTDCRAFFQQVRQVMPEVTRIQAVTNLTQPSHGRFAKALGFRFEALMPCFGLNKETYELWGCYYG
jgi:hypothetical protein